MRRVLPVLLVVAASLPAQQPHPKHGSLPLPLHRAQPELPPLLALHHLETGVNGAPARPRPAGAGRYVAAVIVCADADLEPARLFAVPRRDLLVIAVPGPVVRRDEIVLLDRMVEKERLALCVVLTHGDCDSLRAKPENHARRTAESILGASQLLADRAAKHRFLVAPGVVDSDTGAIRWLLTAAERLPLPAVPPR